MAAGIAGGFATANYDQEVSDLAASILSQIENDVPPTTISGSNLDTPIVDTTNGLIGSMFTKTEKGFLLTPKSLNERLNGGVLTKDMQEAVNYLYEAKLTKYNTTDTFQIDSPLRRDEAAKFFSVFAATTLNRTEDNSKSCSFTDLASGHTDLQTNMISACKMGIFKGKDGMFYPTNSLTNGEALTVLIRIIHGSMDETNKEHWAKFYWQKAQSYGLTQGSVIDSMNYLDKPITRGDMARLFEAARFITILKLDIGSDIIYSLESQGFIPLK